MWDPHGMDSSQTPLHRRHRVLIVVIAALAVVALIGLGFAALTRDGDPVSTNRPSTPPPGPATTTATRQTEPPGSLVLAISVDGLNPDALSTLGESGAPSFWRLINEGASTLNARTAFELTITLPNHTGMLTGRGVAGASGHGVTFNDDNGTTLQDTHGSYVPGVFDVAHDNGLGTAFFAEKDKFRYLLRSWDDTHGATDTTGKADGRDKTDTDEIGETADLAPDVKAALEDDRTGLIFLHLKDPDVAGHATGWLGPVYLEAVRSVDDQLGSILRTIDANPTLRDRITILLTADHGGERGLRKHDEATRLANYRVPFIAWGRGVARGVDLYALNDGRTDPGEGRPDYTGAQPVRNIDLADTALSILGLPVIEGAGSSGWPRLRLSPAVR